MTLSFFRKVGFGLGQQDEVPGDPLNWAQSQLNVVPEFIWKDNLPNLTESLFKV